MSKLILRNIVPVSLQFQFDPLKSVDVKQALSFELTPKLHFDKNAGGIILSLSLRGTSDSNVMSVQIEYNGFFPTQESDFSREELKAIHAECAVQLYPYLREQVNGLFNQLPITPVPLPYSFIFFQEYMQSDEKPSKNAGKKTTSPRTSRTAKAPKANAK